MTDKGYYLKLNGCGDFQINTWTASNQYITHWLYFLKLKRDNIFGFCSSCVGNVIWNIRKLHITVSTRSRTNVHAWYVRVLFFCFFHTWFKHTVDISSPSTLFCLSLSGSRGGRGGRGLTSLMQGKHHFRFDKDKTFQCRDVLLSREKIQIISCPYCHHLRMANKQT